MSFQPILPISGFAGWRFLERTIDNQKAAFNESVTVKSAAENFREKIGNVTSAEDLVNDRRLLDVALGAFDLSDDINNKYFIQKVLEDGTLDDDALGNRLSDKRYLELSKAFGFGDFDTPNTVLSTFADDIIQRYEDKSFEVAVGNVDSDLRLALNLSTSLDDIVDSTDNENAQWFSVMGSPPMRRVFEVALGLPSSIGAIDLDQQLKVFKESAERLFDTDKVAELNNPEKEEEIIRLFLLRSQVQSSTAISGGSIAVTLLSQIA